MRYLSPASNPYSLMRQLVVVAFAGIALLLTGCASTGGPAASVTQPPKNIIIMFADGATPTQWELGRYSSQRLRKQPFAVTDTVFKQGVLGLLTTHPANAMVTDSAAAIRSPSLISILRLNPMCYSAGGPIIFCRWGCQAGRGRTARI